MPTYIRVKDLPNSASSLNTDDFIMLSGSIAGARKIQKSDFLSTVADEFNASPSTYKLATLDASNKVDSSQWPASAFSYQGTWAASSNTPTLANGSGTAGYTYYASDSGSVNFGAGSISFTAGDAVVYDGSIWQKVPDVANILDGKGTVDEGKTTLQIPNVGTAANEVPVNGMLGDLAFQSSAGVVVDDLTVDGQLTAAVGKPMPVNGPSMRFDGVDDHVSFAAPVGSAFSFTNGTDDTPFSVSAWVKMEADAFDYGIVSKYGSSTSTQEWTIYSSGSGKLRFSVKDSGGDYVGFETSDAMTEYIGQYIYLTVTYAGAGPNSGNAFGSAFDGMSFFINGKPTSIAELSSGTYSGMSSTAQAVTIGRSYSSAFSYKGEIRDVKLYNKELSLAEVREVYSNGQLPESFAESTGSAEVVTDGGFENWTTSTDLTDWSERANVSTAQESTDKLSGSYSCKLTGGGDIGSSGNNWLRQAGVAFNANKKYRLSGRVKRFSGSTNTLQFGASYFKIIEFNGTTFFPRTASSELPFIGPVTSKSLGNGWYSFEIDFTTTVTNTFNIGVNGSTDPYLIDDVSLVQIGSVLDARAENYNQSAGKLLDVSGNDFVGDQSGGVELLTPRSHLSAGTLDLTNLPTSATGLSAGEVYNDSGTLKIV